ncbi:MAG: MarR family winged helix-turn-helix transcriptional regulator [Dehalococcoidia bacterium]
MLPDSVKREREVATRLHSMAIHLLRRLRREDAALGISAARLSALSVVVFGGPLTLGELAAAENVTPPTMTRLVTALEADGLVTRSTDTADKRVTRVRATPKGRRLMERGRDQRTARLTAQLGDLAPDDLAALERAVSIVEGLMESPQR